MGIFSHHTRRRILFLLLGLLLLSLTNATPTHAHDSVSVGKYELALGWVIEPPLLGIPNAVFISITNSETGQPVEGVNTLLVSVMAGGQTRALTLRALEGGAPGEYAAGFIPTARGTYTIKLDGAIQGQEVNVTKEIEEVEPADSAQFPVVLPSLPQINQQLSRLQAENEALQASVALSRWLGIGGLLLGLAGLAVGVVALRKQ
ncbi:MAG: hypothetical protein ACE5E7_02065 [Anaerolineae bacterium]